MIWLVFASLNPVSDAIRNVISKKASRKVNPAIISWFHNAIPLLLFLPLLFVLELRLTTEFFVAVCISGIINFITAIIYHKAIAEGELSEVIPMISFTPLFLLFLSPLISGELPTAQGIAGVLLITLGSYMLNLQDMSKSLFLPLKKMFSHRPMRLMLIVAFLWSISANYDKVGVSSSSALQYSLFLNLLIVSLSTPYVFFIKKMGYTDIKPELKKLVLVGLFTALSYYFHMMALSMTYVAYVVALKRTSGLLTILQARFFLREGNFRNRIAGAVVMFTGVLLIIFS